LPAAQPKITSSPDDPAARLSRLVKYLLAMVRSCPNRPGPGL